MKEWNLYLDMDGVLADFDKRAKAILGMPPGEFEEKYGSKEYWHRLQSTDDFYFSFDKMDDADILFAAVKHLDPIVLTGVPRGFQAQTQKMRWIAQHFGPEVPVITCRAKQKSRFCRPGDVIIDDRKEYRHLWEAKGGHWILHQTAEQSLRELRELKAI